MNVNDLKKSRFLTQHECDPPIKVTIVGCESRNVSPDGADPDEKYVLLFQETDKPLVLNSTNGQIIAAITGTGDIGEDGHNWDGTEIVLYRDPNIAFGGKLVGGIRVRAPKTQTTAAKPNPAMKPKPTTAPVDPDTIPF
jgi:hypothetical protein